MMASGSGAHDEFEKFFETYGQPKHEQTAWQALGPFALIEVKATYLEELPFRDLFVG